MCVLQRTESKTYGLLLICAAFFPTILSIPVIEADFYRGEIGSHSYVPVQFGDEKVPSLFGVTEKNTTTIEAVWLHDKSVNFLGVGQIGDTFDRPRPPHPPLNFFFYGFARF